MRGDAATPFAALRRKVNRFERAAVWDNHDGSNRSGCDNQRDILEDLSRKREGELTQCSQSMSNCLGNAQESHRSFMEVCVLIHWVDDAQNDDHMYAICRYSWKIM